MALCKEKIEHGEIENLFPRKRARIRKWMKNQTNRFTRREFFDEDSSTKYKRPTKGWEF